MDGTLRSILLDRPTKLAKFLESKGVQTCTDVRYLWPTGKELLDDVELACGAFPSDEAFQVVVAYTLASSQASLHATAAVKALVDERESTIPGRAVVLTEAPEPPKSKIRSVINACMADRLPNLDAAIELEPEVKEQAKRPVKTQALFEFVLDDPTKLQSLKDSLMACTARLSLERIGSLLAAVRRWHRWAVEHGVTPRAPTPMELSEFYRSVASGGPTAAASLFQALKWFESNYGVPFHCSHYLIQPYRLHAASHEGRQQAELQPWEYINLLILASRSQGTKLMLATFLLQAATCCIRFEHFQRSKLVHNFGHWLKFKCAKGKARRQGTRPSYEWAMPEVQWQGWSLLATTADFLKHEAWPDASFLWPSVVLDPDDLWQIHSGTPFQVQKPMPRGRFLEIYRGMLVEIGVPKPEAHAAGFNRLRRFLPTLANCLQFEPVALQAIGSWFEIPDGGGPAPTSRPARASMPMGLHYSGEKASRSALVKVAALETFFKLWRRKQPEVAFNEEGLIAPHSWTWPELAAVAAAMQTKCPVPEAFPSLPEPAAEPGSGSIEVAEGALKDMEPGQPPSPASDLASVMDDNPDASEVSSVSPSASDVSADGADLVGVIPPEELVDELRWFQQHDKIHISRAAGEDGRFLPWCREAAFVQDPIKSGEGLSTLQANRVCQRCLSRMPRALYAALSDHCGWAH